VIQPFKKNPYKISRLKKPYKNEPFKNNHIYKKQPFKQKNDHKNQPFEKQQNKNYRLQKIKPYCIEEMNYRKSVFIL
jgi:hypothetical protein